MVKYSLLWIQIKIIQEIEEPEFSSLTFANSYYKSKENKDVFFQDLDKPSLTGTESESVEI